MARAAGSPHAKTRERPLADGRIRRERRHDEREPRLPVRILRAIELRFENLLPARHLAHGQLQRHRDFVGLGERQARNLLVAAPHALEPRHAVRDRTISR